MDLVCSRQKPSPKLKQSQRLNRRNLDKKRGWKGRAQSPRFENRGMLGPILEASMFFFPSTRWELQDWAISKACTSKRIIQGWKPSDRWVSFGDNNVKHENEGDADDDDPSYNAKNKQRTWKKTNNSKFWTESANPQQMQCFRAIDRVNQQHENDWEHLSVSNRPFQMGIAKAAEKFEPPARKEEEPVELPPEVGNSETGGIW